MPDATPMPLTEFAPRDRDDPRDYVAELWRLSLQIARERLSATAPTEETHRAA